MATARRDAPTKYLPTWWETRRRTGGCQGQEIYKIQGRKTFIFIYLQFCWQRRTMLLSRCFCCFKPVTLLFNLINMWISLNLQSDFYFAYRDNLNGKCNYSDLILSDLIWIFCAWNFFFYILNLVKNSSQVILSIV